MKIAKLTTLFTIAAMAMGALSASAQLKLPKSHNEEHRALLANQRSVTSNFKLEADKSLFEDVKARETYEIGVDPEVYGSYWESQSVNPYGTAAVIPSKAVIDVSEFVAPVPGRLTSPYGWRSRFGRMHYGVDINLHVGDTVRAAFSGKIRLTKYEAKGYGYYVVMRHDNGMETVYGHLSRFLVKPNQIVKAGDPIALGGNTGRSTGPHLHFETRFMGLAINPQQIIDFDSKLPLSATFAFDKTIHGKKSVGPKRTKTRTTASKRRRK